LKPLQISQRELFEGGGRQGGDAADVLEADLGDQLDFGIIAIGPQLVGIAQFRDLGYCRRAQRNIGNSLAVGLDRLA
jgi:hypothetical protein